jgi:AcrR family transcriptional regulator
MARPQKVSDETILAAARTYFVEQGAHASTDLLADQLGVSSAALFKRFGTKHNLLVAALTPQVPRWVLTLDEGPDAAPSMREQLEAVAGKLLRFLGEALPCVLALRNEIPVDVPRHQGTPMPVLVQQQLAKFITIAQAQGRLGPCDPLAAAQALVGGIQARVMLEHLGGDPPGDDAGRVHALIDVLFAGIAPSSTGDEEPT